MCFVGVALQGTSVQKRKNMALREILINEIFFILSNKDIEKSWKQWDDSMKLKLSMPSRFSDGYLDET